MDYRSTLNLPVTLFSMKADLSKNEYIVLDFWHNIDLYNQNINIGKKFVLNDGPPYANGNIHIGHAFNKILKDIVVKFKILDGYDVCFIPGWDCHGLPIELNVEKKNKNKRISSDKFRFDCRQYALVQIDIQKKSFLRLGITANWNRFYKTMDNSFELAIVDSFRLMLKKGYIYSGSRPIYWCFNCSSALAEAEIEYDFKVSDSIYVLFKLVGGSFYRDLINKFFISTVYFIVWTTTPWTLPFNQAIAYKSDYVYVLIRFQSNIYLLGVGVVFDFLEKFKLTDCDILLFFNSCLLFNGVLFHPFYEKEVNIFAGEHVKSDSGTGFVHIAPGYGYDDYKFALKNNLVIKNDIDDKGFVYDDNKLFAGLYIDDVSLKVIKLLKLKNNLLFYERISHRYPFCWRHRTQLIFRTTKQWFFNMNTVFFKNKLLDIVSNSIKWIPEVGKEKMLSMLKDRPDWCVSRQRVWGVPIVLFVDKNGKIHPDMFYIFSKVFDLIKVYGVEFWYRDDLFDLLSVDKSLYYKVVDVLDVWFDSSVVYKYISEFYAIKLPFDLCIEGSDQYRGWFQVSIINSVSLFSTAPYKTILSHGFVLDKSGRKMSKSLNNVILPNDIVAKHGADILRLWVFSVNYCFDVSISDEILLRISDTYRKMRNTFRFCLSNLYDFNGYDVQFSDVYLLLVDRWILYSFYILKEKILFYFNSYKFYFAYKKLYNFCVDDLGGKYFDLVKDRLYTSRFDSIYRRSVQFVLFYLVYNLSKCLAPVLSFTSEEAWKFLPIKDTQSVFLSKFSVNLLGFNSLLFNIHNCIFWYKLFDLRKAVNKFIEKKRQSSFFTNILDLEINFTCNVYWYNLLSVMENELYSFFLVSFVKLTVRSDLCLSKLDIYGISLDIKKSSNKKCDRCWNRRVLNFSKLSICRSCILNLYYDGALRKLL